jgi:hypothetical protein
VRCQVKTIGYLKFPARTIRAAQQKGDEMNRLFDIARELGDIAQKRMTLRRELAENEAMTIIREAAIVPDGGWPGGNADTRKAAEKAAKGTDQELLALMSITHDYQFELEQLEVKRDVLVAERDAWQWTIRDNENVAISGVDSVFDMMKLYHAAELEIKKSELPY